MKIEAGKFYETRDGQKEGPIEAHSDPDSFYKFRCNFNYSAFGRIYENRESPNDLIAEWIDEPRPWGELTDAEKGTLALASLQGKTMQRFFERTETWVDDDFNPEAHWNFAYRVKPEPVVETMTLTGFPDDEEGTWCFGKVSIPEDTHRITFTTKDGEPDCDSIKMERIDD